MQSIENYRMQSDKRQFGGMLMLLGFCCIIQPMANLVSAFGPDGANTTDPSEIPFWGMIGAFSLFINGVFAVFTGYMSNTHDFSHQYLTSFLIVLIQAAWIPYITDMTNVGKHAKDSAEDNVFIPLAYEPTDSDVKFVGAMGILGILTYGFAFVGSVSFMVFCLHAYNTGKAEERSGSYFQGRLGFYSGVLALGGLAQLMLGAYCRVNFGQDGVLSEGPVRAAMFTVTYPTISIFVGLYQVLMGVWGTVRSIGYHRGPNDFVYQVFLGVQWLMILSLQDIAQIGYLPGGQLAAAAPTLVAMSFGINLMPAFLDHKMRTLPFQFPSDYYALPTKMMVAKTVESSEQGGATMTKDSASFEVPHEPDYAIENDYQDEIPLHEVDV